MPAERLIAQMFSHDLFVRNVFASKLRPMNPRHLLTIALSRLLITGLVLSSLAARAQDEAQKEQLIGSWVINEELSDSTDKQVEIALKASGQRIERSWFDRRKDKYRGGPADQELYDRISYDMVLEIRAEGDNYEFEYADDFVRPVFTDNRSRSVSLNALDSVEDFSLGHWENGKFLVEAHPRDSGSTNETYTLLNGGTQLRAEFFIRPGSFTETIELTRVYDRKSR